MDAKTQQGRVQRFLKTHINSPYFFSNGKTQIAVDFRVCPLMKKVNGLYKSPVCKACYSKNILTVYPTVRKKIENLPKQTAESLAEFEKDCAQLKEKFGWDKIRFYALSDFGPEDIPFIHAARKYFTVDIISKSLVFTQNEKYLVSLFNLENVWISLSFNEHNKSHMSKIKEILQVYMPKNVQLNYMMSYPEEDPTWPEFNDIQVFHFRNNNKRSFCEKIGLHESRVCGIFDINGKPVEGHGHCSSCNNCHESYIGQKDSNILLDSVACV